LATRAKLRRNLAFLNRYTGFDSNDGPGAFRFEDNTGYGDGQQEFAMDPYPAIVLAGNIAVGATDWLGGQTMTGNSWQMGGAFPSDFQSTDPTGTDGPRQPDGSLPVLPFLRPVAGGRLAGMPHVRFCAGGVQQ
jgi:hypothetical protein